MSEREEVVTAPVPGAILCRLRPVLSAGALPRNLFISAFFCVLASGPVASQDQKMPADGAERIQLANGITYSILSKGEPGTRPMPGDRVRFHYSGWMQDGTLFETSRRGEKPLERILGVGMPKAWSLALGLMTKGTRAKFAVPASLCFGKWGSPGNPPDAPPVPPDSPVVFEFELDSFEKAVVLPVFRVPGKDELKATSSGLKYQILSKAPKTAVDTPKSRGRFTVAFSMFNERSNLVVTSRLPQIAHMTGRLVGRLDGPAFLAEAIGMLHLGERIRFEVAPEDCYGKTDRGYLCPPNSRTYWDLELLELGAAPVSQPVPAFAKLARGARLKTTSGLSYEVVKQGTGAAVQQDAEIELHFAGWQANGRLFEESYSKGLPLSFAVSDAKVIKAWTEGLQLMREGSVYRFVVPPALGYGTLGNPGLGIGPNRVLYFHIEVLRVL